MSFSTRTGVAAAGWAGACFAGGCATSLGIGGTYTKLPGAVRPRCADELHRTPKEIAAVQARFQMAARRRNKPCPPCKRGHARQERRARSARLQRRRQTTLQTNCARKCELRRQECPVDSETGFATHSSRSRGCGSLPETGRWARQRLAFRHPLPTLADANGVTHSAPDRQFDRLGAHQNAKSAASKSHCSVNGAQSGIGAIT